MAEAVLGLSDRHEQIRQASPLERLRAGNLEGAMALADLQDPEPRVLWYLLLAFELNHAGPAATIHMVMSRFTRGTNPQLSEPTVRIAVDLLASITAAISPNSWNHALRSYPVDHEETGFDACSSCPRKAAVKVVISGKLPGKALRICGITFWRCRSGLPSQPKTR